jgi:hypothetical protein
MSVRHVDVAGLPAIGTVILSVLAKAYIIHSLTVAAIAVASTQFLRLIALRALDR